MAPATPVTLKTGMLVGNRWRDAGDVVEVPEDRAKYLIEQRHAVAGGRVEQRSSTQAGDLEQAGLTAADAKALKRAGIETVEQLKAADLSAIELSNAARDRVEKVRAAAGEPS